MYLSVCLSVCLLACERVEAESEQPAHRIALHSAAAAAAAEKHSYNIKHLHVRQNIEYVQNGR